MDVRGATRAIVVRRKDFPTLLNEYDSVNSEIQAAVLETFKKNGVPLLLQNAQISNAKPDEAVWSSQNASAAADARVVAIEKLGRAIRENPGYLQLRKIEMLEGVAKSGPQNGLNTIIITDGGSTGSWPEAAYLKQQLTKP
jgi:hypothetical protein